MLSLQKLVFWSGLVVAVSASNLKQRKLQNNQPFLGGQATLGPTDPPGPVVYAEGTYVNELSPFNISVIGTPSVATLGLNDYLLTNIRGQQPSLWELSINMTSYYQQPGGGFVLTYRDGYGRFLSEENPVDRLSQEEFQSWQRQLLSNANYLNQFWAANPQYGTGLQWTGYTENVPTTAEQNDPYNYYSGNAFSFREPWVIAVVIVVIVIIITICIFLMPRA